MPKPADGALEARRDIVAIPVLAGLMCLGMAIGAGWGQTFTDVGVQTGARAILNVHGSGFLDIDGDDWNDIFVIHNWSSGVEDPYKQSPNALFHNLGTGLFSSIATQLGLQGYAVYPGATLASAQALAAGDYNNDGALDMAVGCGNHYTQAVIYRHNANGTFTDVGMYGLPDQFTTRSRCAAFIDFDQNGFLDLLFLRGDYINNAYLFSLYRERRDYVDHFVNVTAQAGLQYVGCTGDDVYGFAVGDFDRDGDSDFYVPRLYEASRFYRNDNGWFNETAAAVGLPNTPGFIGALFLDYDNDGWMDLLLKRQSMGPLLFKNQGGTFTDVSAQSGISAINTGTLDLGESGFGGGLTPADFDNDGDVDVLSIAKTGPDLKLLRNRSDGTFEEAIQSTGLYEPSKDWYWCVPAGDYNRDGYIDLFMGNGFTKAANPTYATLFRNNGGSNRSFLLDLTGTLNNRSAVGTLVFAYGNGKIQTRQVLGGDGFKVLPFTVHFGMGQASRFDSVVVLWPRIGTKRIRQVLVGAPAFTAGGVPLKLRETAGDTTLYFGPYSVSGEVRHAGPGAFAVSDVSVVMTGGVHLNSTTDAIGRYALLPIETEDEELTVTPAKNRGEEVGATSVTAYDAALVLRTVLHLDESIDRTRILAAHTVTDTNEALDASDAAFIARYAVGLTGDARSRAGRWLFLPGIRTYASVRRFFDHEDFQALVVGDVSLNWGGAVLPGKAARKCEPAAAVECAGDSTVMEVPVFVEAGSGMLAGDFSLGYDPACLKFKDAAGAGPAAGFSVVWNEKPGGIVNIAEYGAEPVTGAGCVLVLRFARVGPFRETAVRWESMAINEQPCARSETAVRAAGSGGNRNNPGRFGLIGGFPNPFNPAASVGYAIERPAEVRLTVYDLQGREVRILFEGPETAGEHATRWDGLDGNGNTAPSGVYFCRLESEGRTSVIKMLRTK
jgi:hypothetical protein